MITTLTKLMEKNLYYDTNLGLWLDSQDTIYKLKDKNIADMVEFDIVEGTEYEYAAALHSLIDDKHGS